MRSPLPSPPHLQRSLTFRIAYRLLDIVHADNKLYLVFEFIDIDLKRYIEHGNHTGKPISLAITKVSWLEPPCCPLHSFSIHGRSLRVPGVFFPSLSRRCMFHTRTTLCSFSGHVATQFTTHTRFLVEIHKAAHSRSLILSLSPNPAPRSQTSEPSHRQT